MNRERDARAVTRHPRGSISIESLAPVGFSRVSKRTESNVRAIRRSQSLQMPMSPPNSNRNFQKLEFPLTSTKHSPGTKSNRKFRSTFPHPTLRHSLSRSKRSKHEPTSSLHRHSICKFNAQRSEISHLCWAQSATIRGLRRGSRLGGPFAIGKWWVTSGPCGLRFLSCRPRFGVSLCRGTTSFLRSFADLPRESRGRARSGADTTDHSKERA